MKFHETIIFFFPLSVINQKVYSVDEKDEKKESWIKCWVYKNPENGRTLFYFNLHCNDGIRYWTGSLLNLINFVESPYPLVSCLFNCLLSPTTSRTRLDYVALSLFKLLVEIPEYRQHFNPDYSDSYQNVLARIQRKKRLEKMYTISDFSVMTGYSRYSHPEKFRWLIAQTKKNTPGVIFETYKMKRSDFERLLSFSFDLMLAYTEVFSKSSIEYFHAIESDCHDSSVEAYYMENSNTKEIIFLFYTSLY